MNDMVKTGSSAMISFTKDQVELIKKQIAPRATTDELALFLYVAQRTGLDPLSRQIHCVHRNSKDPVTGQYGQKMTIQTGIDGFRVIAERTGKYAGQDEPEFVYVRDKDTGEEELLAAKVRVYKWGPNDQRYVAAVGVAFWDEYCVNVDEYNQQGKKTGQKIPNTMWEKMPHGQLAKVAESLALRKAFPQDLSGLYTNDEMAQAENVGEALPPVAQELLDTKESLEELDAKYQLWVDQYLELFGENETAPIRPVNWKRTPTKKDYVLALQAIQTRVEEEKRKRGIK